MSEHRYVVTLVHGTFAREPEKRAWTLPGSSTHKTLEAVLGGDGSATVEFTEPFEWSGENDHGKRLQAGRELATRLQTETRSPGERRVLMGHSHGGNVVLYALEELVARGKEELVGAVVCLATPHVDAEPRPLKESFQAIGVLSALVAATAWVQALSLVFFGPGAVGNPAQGSPNTWQLLLMSGGMIVVPFLVFHLVNEKLREHVERVAATKAKDLQAEAPPTTPLLSVNVEGDEALRALRIVERTAASPVAIWKGLLGVGALVLSLSAYVGGIFGAGFGEPDNSVDRMFGTILTYLFLALVASLVLVWLVSFFRLGFGRESLIVRTCIDVGVRTEPHGFELPRCEQRTFESAELEAELRGLAHSKPYASGTIVAYVGEWIRRARGPTAGP